MSQDAEAKLQGLREENKLLLLQLHQIQEELERYYSENRRLKSEESEAVDTPETKTDDAADAPGSVENAYRGSWALVRHLLDHADVSRPATPSLEAIVQSDPLYEQQTARANRAEAQLDALQGHIADDSARALERANTLTKKLDEAQLASQERAGEIATAVSSLEVSLAEKMGGVISALESALDARMAVRDERFESRLSAFAGSLESVLSALNDRAGDTRVLSTVAQTSGIIAEKMAVLEERVVQLEGSLSTTLEKKLDPQLSALAASLQVHFLELEKSLNGLKASTESVRGDVVDAMGGKSRETSSSDVEKDDFMSLMESFRELSDTLHKDALAPAAAAQREAEALRGDLSVALKMQAVRDSDLKELQERFARLSEDKTEQEAVLIELREKLAAASAYLKSLRSGSGEASEHGAARDIAALLGGDD